MDWEWEPIGDGTVHYEGNKRYKIYDAIRMKSGLREKEVRALSSHLVTLEGSATGSMLVHRIIQQEFTDDDDDDNNNNNNEDDDEEEICVEGYWYYTMNEIQPSLIKKYRDRGLILSSTGKELLLSFHKQKIGAGCLEKEITVYYSKGEPKDHGSVLKKKSEYVCSFVFEPAENGGGAHIHSLADNDFEDTEIKPFKSLISELLRHRPYAHPCFPPEKTHAKVDKRAKLIEQTDGESSAKKVKTTESTPDKQLQKKSYLELPSTQQIDELFNRVLRACR